MLHADPLEQEAQVQGDLQERWMERERQELVVVDGRIQTYYITCPDCMHSVRRGLKIWDILVQMGYT